MIKRKCYVPRGTNDFFNPAAELKLLAAEKERALVAQNFERKVLEGVWQEDWGTDRDDDWVAEQFDNR